jgi:hypothetical protein
MQLLSHLYLSSLLSDPFIHYKLIQKEEELTLLLLCSAAAAVAVEERDAWAEAAGQSQVDKSPCGVVLDNSREACRVVRI